MQVHQRDAVVEKTDTAAQFQMICSKRQKRKRRAWTEVVATGDSFAIKAHAKLDLQLWTEYNPVEHKHTVFAVADIRRIGALKSDAGPEIARFIEQKKRTPFHP